MLHKIHWQLDQKYHISFDMNNHNLASYRMRLGLTLNKSFKYNLSASYELNKHAKILLIPTITQNYESIIVNLNKYKNANTKIILDYTDNHYFIKSNHHQFYRKVFDDNYIDQVIVNSTKMKKITEKFFKGTIDIIPDPVEIKTQQIIKSNQDNLLWFGHMSNFEFLIKKLNEWPSTKINKLMLLTNYTPDMVPHFNNVMREYSNKIFNSYALYPWSYEQLIYQSKNTNKIIIPGNKDDLKKAGVSSNRLITSFALGKMVAATNYESYSPYSNYYIDIDDNEKFNNFIKANFKEDVVKKAFRDVLPYFSREFISSKWENLINNLQ